MDLSFLKPFFESTEKVTNKQAITLAKKVAEKIVDLSEGMDSVSQQRYKDLFEKVRSVKRFDEVMNSLYDYCDAHRIWVKTWF